MGRPCTHESLGGKQGKPGGLAVQTLGAKCGDRGQVKRALRIGVTEGSGHVCPGKLNHPLLLSAGQAPDVRYSEKGNEGFPSGWNEGFLSECNEGFSSGWNEGFPFGWNE